MVILGAKIIEEPIYGYTDSETKRFVGGADSAGAGRSDSGSVQVYGARVRIDFLETTSSNQTFELFAPIVTMPGIKPGYKEGDTVLVAFLENEFNHPVIIGRTLVQKRGGGDDQEIYDNVEKEFGTSTEELQYGLKDNQTQLMSNDIYLSGIGSVCTRFGKLNDLEAQLKTTIEQLEGDKDKTDTASSGSKTSGGSGATSGKTGAQSQQSGDAGLQLSNSDQPASDATGARATSENLKDILENSKDPNLKMASLVLAELAKEDEDQLIQELKDSKPNIPDEDISDIISVIGKTKDVDELTPEAKDKLISLINDKINIFIQALVENNYDGSLDSLAAFLEVDAIPTEITNPQGTKSNNLFTFAVGNYGDTFDDRLEISASDSRLNLNVAQISLVQHYVTSFNESSDPTNYFMYEYLILKLDKNERLTLELPEHSIPMVNNVRSDSCYITAKSTQYEKLPELSDGYNITSITEWCGYSPSLLGPEFEQKLKDVVIGTCKDEIHLTCQQTQDVLQIPWIDLASAGNLGVKLKNTDKLEPKYNIIKFNFGIDRFKLINYILGELEKNFICICSKSFNKYLESKGLQSIASAVKERLFDFIKYIYFNSLLQKICIGRFWLFFSKETLNIELNTNGNAKVATIDPIDYAVTQIEDLNFNNSSVNIPLKADRNNYSWYTMRNLLLDSVDTFDDTDIYAVQIDNSNYRLKQDLQYTESSQYENKFGKQLLSNSTYGDQRYKNYKSTIEGGPWASVFVLQQFAQLTGQYYLNDVDELLYITKLKAHRKSKSYSTTWLLRAFSAAQLEVITDIKSKLISNKAYSAFYAEKTLVELANDAYLTSLLTDIQVELDGQTVSYNSLSGTEKQNYIKTLIKNILFVDQDTILTNDPQPGDLYFIAAYASGTPNLNPIKFNKINIDNLSNDITVKDYIDNVLVNFTDMVTSSQTTNCCSMGFVLDVKDNYIVALEGNLAFEFSENRLGGVHIIHRPKDSVYLYGRPRYTKDSTSTDPDWIKVSSFEVTQQVLTESDSQASDSPSGTRSRRRASLRATTSTSSTKKIYIDNYDYSKDNNIFLPIKLDNTEAEISLACWLRLSVLKSIEEFAQIESKDIDTEYATLALLEWWKAQAVINRTAVLRSLVSSATENSEPCDVTISGSITGELSKLCFAQKYSELKSCSNKYKLAFLAQTDTDGEIITYNNCIIRPKFHHCSIGRTLSYSDVFGGEYDYPFLKSVQTFVDIEDRNISSTKDDDNFYIYEMEPYASIDGKTVQQTYYVRPNEAITYDIAASYKHSNIIVSNYIPEDQYWNADWGSCTGSGSTDCTVLKYLYVKSSDENSLYAIPGNEVQSICNTQSNIFKIKDRNAIDWALIYTDTTDTINIQTFGFGNSCGASQSGLKYLTKQNISHERSLAYYYTGTKLSLIDYIDSDKKEIYIIVNKTSQKCAISQSVKKVTTQDQTLQQFSTTKTNRVPGAVAGTTNAIELFLQIAENELGYYEKGGTNDPNGTGINKDKKSGTIYYTTKLVRDAFGNQVRKFEDGDYINQLYNNSKHYISKSQSYNSKNVMQDYTKYSFDLDRLFPARDYYFGEINGETDLKNIARTFCFGEAWCTMFVQWCIVTTVVACVYKQPSEETGGTRGLLRYVAKELEDMRTSGDLQQLNNWKNIMNTIRSTLLDLLFINTPLNSKNLLAYKGFNGLRGVTYKSQGYCLYTSKNDCIKYAQPGDIIHNTGAGHVVIYKEASSSSNKFISLEGNSGDGTKYDQWRSQIKDEDTGRITREAGWYKTEGVIVTSKTRNFDDYCRLARPDWDILAQYFSVSDSDTQLDPYLPEDDADINQSDDTNDDSNPDYGYGDVGSISEPVSYDPIQTGAVASIIGTFTSIVNNELNYIAKEQNENYTIDNTKNSYFYGKLSNNSTHGNFTKYHIDLERFALVNDSFQYYTYNEDGSRADLVSWLSLAPKIPWNSLFVLWCLIETIYCGAIKANAHDSANNNTTTKSYDLDEGTLLRNGIMGVQNKKASLCAKIVKVCLNSLLDINDSFQLIADPGFIYETAQSSAKIQIINDLTNIEVGDLLYLVNKSSTKVEKVLAIVTEVNTAESKLTIVLGNINKQVVKIENISITSSTLEIGAAVGDQNHPAHNFFNGRTYSTASNSTNWVCGFRLNWVEYPSFAAQQILSQT